MHALTLHPDCPQGTIQQITAHVEATLTGCFARFVVIGDAGAVIIPEKAAAGRMDDLWKTTCFEIFWGRQNGSYREFNLSPSSRWACYDFDSFREGMRDAPAEVSIDFDIASDRMELVADIKCELPVPADIALNAVIEDTQGNTQFWALAFAPGKPDFHHKTCRALYLTETSQ